MSVCRTCLQINAKKDITLLKLKNQENEKQSYEEIVEFCLGIQVTLKENISTKLCLKCYRKILEFYNFKALALKNDAYLKSCQLGTVVLLEDTIKKEDNDSVKVMRQTNSNLSENEVHYDDEPLVFVKEECKLEYVSDDELLTVFKANGDTDDKRNIIIEDPKVKVKNGQKIKGTRKRTKEFKPKDVSVEEKKMCDICGKEVKCLKTHQLCHNNTSRQRFECDLCGKSLSSKAGMKLHFKRTHLNICKECPDCGIRVKNLGMHRKLKHNPEPLPFLCVPCGRRFMYRAALDCHMRVHTKNTPFECDICGKTFRLKHTMALHIRQVHENERSHMCQFCSKTFFKKYQLQMHLRTHTKEKPYECPECDKRFLSSSILKNHLLVHRGDKKYSCKMCDMTFISPKYVTTHMKSHIKDKKYPCQYCNVRFHRSDHRKRHEFTAHLKHNTQDNTVSS